MIGDLLIILAGLLVLAGSGFAAIAALGILRLPDIYNRMHSASKAGAVGAGMLLLALALTSDSTPATLRALAAVAFILLTAPLAAHLLAKAAYSVGYKLGPESVLDEMPPPRATNASTDAPDGSRDPSPQPVVDRA